MFVKLTLLLCSATIIPYTVGENLPSPDTEAIMKFVPFVNSANFLDGPSRISNALTTPTTNTQPTLAEMKYYNYYAAAMYCQYELNSLNCTSCQKFKKDVNDHTGKMSRPLSGVIATMFYATQHQNCP